MDERRALMAAIIANPEEDTPRLAFADWLQENGDQHDRARAEFIRLQVEAFPLRRGDRSRVKLVMRAVFLQKKHAKHWLGPLAKVEKSPRFERGLLVCLQFSPADFLKRATQQALIEGLPFVGMNLLVLHDETKRVVEVTESPALGLVSGLMWCGSLLTDDQSKALANSPNLSHLTTLNLFGIRATDSGLKALAKSRGFARLRKLRISPVHLGEGMTEKGVRALIASDTLSWLDTFALSTASGVKMPAFCKEPALAKLKSLYLELVSEPSGPVCRCPHLTSLEELTLNCIGDGTLTEGDIRALLDNPVLANLKRLTLAVRRKAEHPGVKLVARLRDRFGDGYSTEPNLKYT